MTAASRAKISSIDSVSFITPTGEILHTYLKEDPSYSEMFLINLEENRIPNAKFFVRLEGKDTGEVFPYISMSKKFQKIVRFLKMILQTSLPLQNITHCEKI